jgi:glycosyltransferase involved in cell wall biosynthesis
MGREDPPAPAVTGVVSDGGDAPDRRGGGDLALAPTPAWPSLEADFESLAADLGRSRPARVAIASYEFTGVVRNGGIGTACTSLARALAEDGHDVDMVFTGWPDDPSAESFDRWRAHYERLGLRLDRIDLSAASDSDSVLYNAVHSLALYRLLAERDRERPYDAIHFVESVGHGFYSLLAKRQGLAFQRATTVVGVHSPRRWLAEAHGIPFDHALDIGDEFLERRSIELADVVVSPSAHMLDWLERRGAALPRRSYVQQYVTNFDPSRDGAGGDAREPVRELVFFGRLEPRKGLLELCDALDLLADGPCAELRRVTFLGRAVPFESVSSDDYVRDRARDWPWQVEVVTDLDRDAALEYLGGAGRLAVMASTMDNSPNTVYEAIGLGIPFLASRGGGTAELVHPDDYERVTYDPRDPEIEEIDPGDPAMTRPRHTGRVLAARLEQALATPPRPARFAVEPARNRGVHLEWHRAVASNGDPRPETARAAGSMPRLPPPRAVSDLAGVDSGDELVLLVDAGVEPAAELASTLAGAAAACPEAGFLTSLGACAIRTPDGEIVRDYLPVGGAPTAGLVGNSFGAGVVLARRDALERIGACPGGLPGDAGVAALLARAALAGERIDVVPEVLYRSPPSTAPDGLLSRAEAAHESLAAYHHALDDGVARDVVNVARRALAEAAALRLRAEAGERTAQAAQHAATVAERARVEAEHARVEAEHARAEAEHASTVAERARAEADARLAIVTSSRSWRLTGLLRRPLATLRRLARRG